VPSTRRRFLSILGTAGISGLAGCTGSLPGGSPRCPAYEAPKWEIDGRLWSPPVVDDGDVLAGTYYTATGNDRSRFVCASASDGQERWIETVEGAGFGVPRVHADSVYVGTGTDRVFALDRETGHRRWTYDAGGREEHGGGVWGQPAVVGDTVVVGVSTSTQTNADPSDPDDYTHRVVGLDRQTGTERWSVEFDAEVWGGPTRDAGSVLVTTRGGTVARLDAATGDVAWTTSFETGFDRGALLVGDRAVVATVAGTVRELAPESGDKGWVGTLSGEPTDWAQTGDSVVVGDAGGTVTAIRPDRDGEQRWQYDAGASVAGIGTHEETVYAFDDRGVVHRIDGTDGSRQDRRRHAETEFDEGCGWHTAHERATGLAVSDRFLVFGGPWLGAVPRDSTE
jgi:outer membrane protein assembly factor BamB